MNRRELTNAVATHVDQDRRVVEQVIGGTVDVILATVSKGEQVTLPGFAKFTKRRSKARTGRNPATGESIRIPARTTAKITPLKGFKDVVLGTAPAPKLGAAPAPAKKAPAGKATATRAVAKKAPARKATAAKAPAKKAPAKKAPARKATATKAPAKKAPARKAPATRAVAKKAPAKKAPARKTPARKGPARR